MKQLSERVLGMVDALGRQVESNSVSWACCRLGYGIGMRRPVTTCDELTRPRSPSFLLFFRPLSASPNPTTLFAPALVPPSQAQSGHHFSTLLSRSSDSLNHLTTLLAPPSPSSSGSWLGGSGSLLAPIGWAGVGAVGGVLFAAWREKRRGGGEAWERKYL